MPENPGQEELIQKIPVKKKNVPDVKDFVHRVVKHPCAIPGNGKSRAYAGFSHTRFKQSKNDIPDTRRNYSGSTSSAHKWPGAGAGCGGRNDQ
jgi:hypothetical protein